MPQIIPPPIESKILMGTTEWEPCRHSGYFHKIKFWIFKKEVFICEKCHIQMTKQEFKKCQRIWKIIDAELLKKYEKK